MSRPAPRCHEWRARFAPLLQMRMSAPKLSLVLRSERVANLYSSEMRQERRGASLREPPELSWLMFEGRSQAEKGQRTAQRVHG
eukprot:scaffold126520_cov17-Tisochrysis_lutea.AAC.1